jgi:hypothetical protein
VSFRRGLLLLVLSLAAAAFLAPSASARPACVFDGTLASAHFVVHWDPDAASTDCPDATDFHQPQAGAVLAAAEASYALWVVKRGFPAPVDDGDGKMDLYVFDTDPYVAIFDADGTGPGPRAGWAALSGAAAAEAHWAGAAAFHGSSLALWGVWQEWLALGTAEWAGLTTAGFPEFGSMLDKPEISLDCYDAPCDEDLFYYSGQARWPFFQYLTDRFGDDAVRDVWTQVAARAGSAADGVGALDDVMVAKGTTLTTVFNDFAGALAAGTVKASNLTAVKPKTADSLKTGALVGSVSTTKVAANHLAVQFVELVPGSGVGSVCHPATLKLEVTIPSGTGAKPSFHGQEYGGLKPFAVSGSTATLTTPWDTCTWASGHKALVAVPNPSTSANGAEFTVTATLTAVDLATILSPDAPIATPDPRPTVPTAAAVPPPTLSFATSAPLRVARNGTLTLAFFATNTGALRVAAGGKTLRTVRVKAGQNVVKLRLPVTKKAARRPLASRPSRLDLTSISPSGVVGRTFVRKLRYAT